MRDAVIVEAVRTPVGKRNGGCQRSSGRAVRARAEVAGRAERHRSRRRRRRRLGLRVARSASRRWISPAPRCWPRAGPSRSPGTRWTGSAGPASRRCTSPRPALVAGQYDVVVAGGVESMTRVPMGSSLTELTTRSARSFGERYRRGLRPNQGVGAEMIAEKWGLSRAQLDEYSLASHERAAAAQDEGRFDGQIAPVTLDDGTDVRRRRGRPARQHGGGPRRAQVRLQARGRRDHRRATPRRSPTARRRC